MNIRTERTDIREVRFFIEGGWPAFNLKYRRGPSMVRPTFVRAAYKSINGSHFDQIMLLVSGPRVLKNGKDGAIVKESFSYALRHDLPDWLVDVVSELENRLPSPGSRPPVSASH